jgi:hypothetical protein
VTKEERRELMPICTAWIDEMREAFEPENIVFIKASENGIEVEWRRGE